MCYQMIYIHKLDQKKIRKYCSHVLSNYFNNHFDHKNHRFDYALPSNYLKKKFVFTIMCSNFLDKIIIEVYEYIKHYKIVYVTIFSKFQSICQFEEKLK
jgi:hypothetical protein